MAELMQGLYEYGVKFVLLVVVMLIGVNLGKIIRIRKDAKNNKENQ